MPLPPISVAGLAGERKPLPMRQEAPCWYRLAVHRALVHLTLLLVLGCKREESKICPDPVASAPSEKSVAPARTIDIPLPKAMVGGEPETVLSVALDAHGKVAVNGLAVADDLALEAEARKAIGKDPNVKAIVLADTSVTHGRVIGVLDRLRLGGIAKIAFAVAAPPPSPAP